MDEEPTRRRKCRLLYLALCLSLLVNGLLCGGFMRGEREMMLGTAALQQSVAMVNHLMRLDDACHAKRKSV